MIHFAVLGMLLIALALSAFEQPPEPTPADVEESDEMMIAGVLSCAHTQGEPV